MPVYQSYTPSWGESFVNGLAAYFQAKRQRTLDDQNTQRFESQQRSQFLHDTGGVYRPTAPTTMVDAPTMTDDDLTQAFKLRDWSLNPRNTQTSATTSLAPANSPPTAPSGGDAFQANLATALARGIRGAGPSTGVGDATSPAMPPMSNPAIALAKSQSFNALAAARDQARDVLGQGAESQKVNALATQFVAPSGTVQIPTTDPRYIPIPDKFGGGYSDTQAPIDRQVLAQAIHQQFTGDRQIAVNDAKPRYALKQAADGSTVIVNLNDPTSAAQPVTLPDGTTLQGPTRAAAAPPHVKVGGQEYERDPRTDDWVPATTVGGDPLREPPRPPRVMNNGATAATNATGRAITANNMQTRAQLKGLPSFNANSLNPQADSASVISARTPVLESLGNLAVRGDSLQRAYGNEAAAIGTSNPVNGAVDMRDVRAQLQDAETKLEAIMRSKAPLSVKSQAQEAFRARVQRLTGGSGQ